MKEFTMPSGAKLEIAVAPFVPARALYQAVLDEAKSLKLDMTADVDGNLYKDLFCAALSSKKIEAALEECMKRSLYNGQTITHDTWEPVKARDDYLTACFEVAKENIAPFMKSLYAQYSHIFRLIPKGPA